MLHQTHGSRLWLFFELIAQHWMLNGQLMASVLLSLPGPSVCLFVHMNNQMIGTFPPNLCMLYYNMYLIVTSIQVGMQDDQEEVQEYCFMR